MTLISIFFWSLIVWWMVLFMVLPIGFGKTGEEKITTFGAPISPLLLKKFALTTIITIVIMGLIWFIDSLGVISVSSWVVPTKR